MIRCLSIETKIPDELSQTTMTTQKDTLNDVSVFSLKNARSITFVTRYASQGKIANS